MKRVDQFLRPTQGNRTQFAFECDGYILAMNFASMRSMAYFPRIRLTYEKVQRSRDFILACIVCICVLGRWSMCEREKAN